MTQSALADACANVGEPRFTAMVIHYLEAGARRFHLRDVSALALALGVSPLLFMLPPDADTRIDLTSTATARAGDVYGWMVGDRPTPTPGDVSDSARGRALLRLRKFIPYAIRAPRKTLKLNDDNIAGLITENEATN